MRKLKPEISDVATSMNSVEIDYGDFSTEVSLTRRSRLRITGLVPEQQYRVGLTLRCGSEEQFTYFPALTSIGINGNCAELVEFELGDQSIEVNQLIGTTSNEGELTIDFDCEFGTTTKKDPVIFLRNIACDQYFEYAGHSAKKIHFETTWRPLHQNLQRPVFVIGPYRSGTSITTWAIGQHPNIAALDETNWLPLTLHGAMAGYDLSRRRAQGSAPEIYDVRLEDYLNVVGEALGRFHGTIARDRALGSLFELKSGMARGYSENYQLLRSRWNPKNRWVDGTPENTFASHLLAEAFPHAQFILLVRDPRKVIASLCHFDRIGGAKHEQSNAVRHWMRFTQMQLALLDSIGPDRAHLLFFDDLANETEGKLRKCFDFLGEPYFAKAKNAFSDRINSSMVGKSDHEALQGDEISLCDAAYASIRSGASHRTVDWGNNDIGSIEDFYRDLTGRMLRIFM